MSDESGPASPPAEAPAAGAPVSAPPAAAGAAFALTAAILDLSADAILTLDAEERITSWNRGAQQLLGWSAEEVVGKHFALLLPEEELARGELEWIRRVTEAKGSLHDYETRRRRKDGEVVDVSLTRTAVFDDDGRLIGFSAILRNITARKEIERRMLRAERLATAGQVAAGVAHEIGAPLTAIAVAVDYMLKTRCSMCGGADEMRVLLSQTDRLAKLARQLVNLARPEELTLAPANLNEIVSQAVALMEPQLRKTRAALTVDLAPELPVVEADDAQLQQVLLNLFFNAQRALFERGGVVRVSTRRHNDAQVEIVVADDGPGIAAADLPHIFLPFFSRAGGTGLGLALAAQIVHGHGGSIDATSEPGRGATFTIRLPVKQAHG